MLLSELMTHLDTYGKNCGDVEVEIMISVKDIGRDLLITAPLENVVGYASRDGKSGSLTLLGSSEKRNVKSSTGL